MTTKQSTRWIDVPCTSCHGACARVCRSRIVIIPVDIRRWLKRELGYVPCVKYLPALKVSPLVEALRRRPRSVEQLSKTTGLEERIVRSTLKKNSKRYAQLSPGLWTLRKQDKGRECA